MLVPSRWGGQSTTNRKGKRKYKRETPAGFIRNTEQKQIVILNDEDREQNHSQSSDMQLDTVQNSTSDVDASAADLLLALVGKPRKQIKQKPVIDAKQVLSETGYLPMAACILQEARKKYSKHSVNERVTLDTSLCTTKLAYSRHTGTTYD